MFSTKTVYVNVPTNKWILFRIQRLINETRIGNAFNINLNMPKPGSMCYLLCFISGRSPIVFCPQAAVFWAKKHWLFFFFFFLFGQHGLDCWQFSGGFVDSIFIACLCRDGKLWVADCFFSNAIYICCY